MQDSTAWNQATAVLQGLAVQSAPVTRDLHPARLMVVIALNALLERTQQVFLVAL